MSSIQPLTKKTHRHHTPARRCAYISLSQHTAEQKLGRLTRQVQTSNALWNIHYDEPRAASRSFFSQRHNIQRRDGRRLVMLSEQVDVSSVGSPWSTISRVQDAKQRGGGERYWQSAAEHEPCVAFPFFNSRLLHSTSVSGASWYASCWKGIFKGCNEKLFLFHDIGEKLRLPRHHWEYIIK